MEGRHSKILNPLASGAAGVGETEGSPTALPRQIVYKVGTDLAGGKRPSECLNPVAEISVDEVVKALPIV